MVRVFDADGTIINTISTGAGGNGIIPTQMGGLAVPFTVLHGTGGRMRSGGA